MHDLLLNVIAVGFIGYGAWRGVTAFYEWAYNRGYESQDRVRKWEFDNLKSQVENIKRK